MENRIFILLTKETRAVIRQGAEELLKIFNKQHYTRLAPT